MDCFSINLSIQLLNPCKLFIFSVSGVRLELFNDELNVWLSFPYYESVSFQLYIMRAKLQSSPINLPCLDLCNALLQFWTCVLVLLLMVFLIIVCTANETGIVYCSGSKIHESRKYKLDDLSVKTSPSWQVMKFTI